MSDLVIVHGQTSHEAGSRWDCMQCIEVELEFLTEIKKAGGLKKFLAKLKKKYG